MTKKEGLALVREYTKNENLVKHMIAVESAMRAYAEKFEENIEEWGLCGLLHDFDYERMGSEHPSPWGFKILKENGISDEIIEAIKGHVDKDDTASRPTLMAKTLFAVDELSGLVVATALPRPNQLSDMKLKSVKKKFKMKAFAQGVNREDIIQGCKELEIDLDDHIQFVITALQGVSKELGLK